MPQPESCSLFSSTVVLLHAAAAVVGPRGGPRLPLGSPEDSWRLEGFIRFDSKETRHSTRRPVGPPLQTLNPKTPGAQAVDPEEHTILFPFSASVASSFEANVSTLRLGVQLASLSDLVDPNIAAAA